MSRRRQGRAGCGVWRVACLGERDAVEGSSWTAGVWGVGGFARVRVFRSCFFWSVGVRVLSLFLSFFLSFVLSRDLLLFVHSFILSFVLSRDLLLLVRPFVRSRAVLDSDG